MTPDLSKLMTVGERHARRHATPKHQLTTKLDRKMAVQVADRADERKLRAWATAVKALDKWKDRHTGLAVRRTHVLAPDSAHAHHIAPKGDWNVRYDVRNGICLSFKTHYAVEMNQLRIVGTKFFTKKGKRYINGRHPVTFEVVA